MADELAEIIKKLKEEENLTPESVPAKPAGPPKPVIYLAECSWDRGDDREKIRSRTPGHRIHGAARSGNALARDGSGVCG